MRRGAFLASAAGLAWWIVAGCGGKLADDPTDAGETDGPVESSSQKQVTCSHDSDCKGQCDDAEACCCDVPTGTCFLPRSGTCEVTTPEGPGSSSGGPPI
jgi:hypothetical protein